MLQFSFFLSNWNLILSCVLAEEALFSSGLCPGGGWQKGCGGKIKPLDSHRTMREVLAFLWDERNK
jgi:hypothetical protein